MVFRAALLGCGRIGSEIADDPRTQGVQSHAGAYVACPDTELVAVCDAAAGKARACGARWQVEAVYTDPERLLEEQRPEVVSICTPDGTHASLLRAALAAPSVRAILAEKPLATSLTEASAIVEMAAERSVALAVNYSRRYARNHNRLKEQIVNGLIGSVQSVAGFYTKGIIHNGTHWFDLARFLIGEIVTIQGFNIRQEAGDDPTADALMVFENGAGGHLMACDASLFAVFEMDIVGTLGRVRLLDGGHTIEFYTVEDSPNYAGYRELLPKGVERGGMEDLLLHAVEDLVLSVKESRPPNCSGADGLAALKAATAARDTAQTPNAGAPIARLLAEKLERAK